jgi:glycerol-3-phosphate dehydrogenase
VGGIETDSLVIGAGAAGMAFAEMAWFADPDVSSWMQRSRLNASSGVRDHLDDPLMKSALERLFTNIEPAIAKVRAFMAEVPPG